MKRKKIRTVWKDYLTLSMRERRGLTVLLSILGLQIFFLYYINSFELNYPYPDVNTLIKLSQSLEKCKQEIHPPPQKASFERFNPNTLPEEKWVQIGLSPKQAHSISNYIAKGGSFKIKKDVKKIYGMNDQLFSSLLPFINLPESIPNNRNNFYTHTYSKKLIELNSADTIALEKLKGIGFKLAARIVKYRDLLGGFYSLDQLKEVWGLNDTTLQLLISQVTLENTSKVKLIDLNKDSLSVFSIHPYIGKRLAFMIANYRKQHGPFKAIDELKVLPLLTDENFRKLAPYLKLD